VTLPMLVGETADRLGLTESQAGIFAAADMGGASVSAFVVSLNLSRLRWRMTLLVALCVLAMANTVSGITTSYGTLLGFRVIAGLAEGVLTSIGLAGIGEARNPDRGFALSGVGQLAFGALGLFAIPWLMVIDGLQAVFWGLALIVMLGIPLTRYVPDDATSLTRAADWRAPLSIGSSLGLGAVLAYFVAQGTVWSYLERLGEHNHIAPTTISKVLSVSSAAGLLGAACAFWLGVKVGRFKLIAAAACVTTLSLAILSERTSTTAFAAGVTMFNFSWNFSAPYQFGALAAIDKSGRTVALASVLVFAGVASGPAIAAAVVRGGNLNVVNGLGILFTALSVTMFAFMFRRAQACPRTAEFYGSSGL
jgi:predicted MFS family arabinose efflux permease